MSEKFKNRYRIPSARMQNWDYGWNAPYFITICTQNRACYFGEIIDGKMKLSEIGEIVKSEWIKTYEMLPDMNLHMGTFVIMPNHFHAIISIGINQNNEREMNDANHHEIQNINGQENEFDTKYMDGGDTGRMDGDDTGRRDAMHCVSTTPLTSQLPLSTEKKFGPQSKNLASIIRGFKSAVTKTARIIDPYFAWQTRFHDHIIRNHESFLRIEQYIIENPAKWDDDFFY